VTQAAPAPTRTRHVVVLYAMALSFLTFLDRATIGQAAPLIRRDLGLSPVEMGYVFSAFGLAYALFELPGGLYCDRKGPRKALTRIVVWWSAFTAATGAAWNLASLWATRFLFGAGEAGCYPSLARVFRTWLPLHERPVAEGWKAASARLGAAAAPYFVVALLRFTSWRGVFAASGAIGMVWAAAFYFWFRDRPSQHGSVNAAELALTPAEAEERGHAAAPWARYAASGSLWLLAIQWFCHFYAFYFYITWLPTYLQEARGAGVERSAVLSGLPVLTAALGSLAGGWILARMIRRLRDVARARKAVAYISYLAAAILMLASVAPASAEWAVAFMALSSFAAEFSAPLTWTTAMDLGGAHVGAVSGAMNSIGQMGGAVAPTVVGYLAAGGPGGWNAALYSAALVYVAGFLCWIRLDPVTPLGRERRA
jgi:ACS family glucarate transporter-like MFS transporter